MNSLCKYMGKDLNILLSKKIYSVNFDNSKWTLKTLENENININKKMNVNDKTMKIIKEKVILDF